MVMTKEKSKKELTGYCQLFCHYSSSGLITTYEYLQGSNVGELVDWTVICCAIHDFLYI